MRNLSLRVLVGVLVWLGPSLTVTAAAKTKPSSAPSGNVSTGGKVSAKRAGGEEKLAGSKKSADAAFERGEYDVALKHYAALAKRPPGDKEPRETRLAALYRAVECEVLLFRYAEANERLKAEPVPQAPLWKARFLLLKAEVAREFLRQYGYEAPTDAEEGSSDVTRRSRADWHREITRAYEALLPLREELAHRKLGQEAYFVDLKSADLERIPTLWDFAVLRFGTYLTGEAETRGVTKPAPETFLAERYVGSITKSVSPVEKAAALYEDASRGPAAGRETAREAWRLERALIPLRAPALVRPFKSRDEGISRAIRLLEAWSGSFRSIRAKSDAAAEAAELMESVKRYADAVARCKEVEAQWPGSAARARCDTLRRRIEAPVLTLRTRPAPPPGKGAVLLDARNVDEAYLRLYPTTAEELRDLIPKAYREDWLALRRLETSSVQTFLKRSPAKAWQVGTKGKKPHFPRRVVADAPALEPGLYVVLASNRADFAAGQALVEGAILNVTRLILFGSAGAGQPVESSDEKSGFHLYAIDGVTGAPAPGTSIDAFLRIDWSTRRKVSGETDADGRETFSVKDAGKNRQVSLDPLATRGKDHAFWDRAHYYGEYPPPAAQLFLETDRPIYRPGQKAQVKLTALKREAENQWHVYDGKSEAELVVRDPNGQEVGKFRAKLGALGSAAVTVDLPPGRLLGAYSVQASLADFGDTFRSYLNFRVEEYKRPEFELSLDDARGAWKYGRPATVKGTAKYYFGGALSDTVVRYRVERETFAPWYAWWWQWRIGDAQPEEVASGEARTDAQGAFSLSFTPAIPAAEEGEKDPFPSRYVVRIEARDKGGRTITAERAYTAGDKAYVWDLSFPDSVAQAGAAAKLNARLVNLNDQPAAEQAEFVIYEISQAPKTSDPEEASDDDSVPARRWHGEEGLDARLRDVPNGRERARGRFATRADAPAPVALPPLPAGLYRLVVTAPDPFGGKVEGTRAFVVADPKADVLSLPVDLAAAEHASYLPGETAVLWVGSPSLAGSPSAATFVEIWHGQRLVGAKKLPGGVRRFELPVTRAHRGGLTVRWFGARDFRIHRGEVRIDVPWKDRDLAVTAKLPKAVKPGEKITWDLTVRDADGNPVDGEATVRVFDRSLEYYAKDAPSWVASLYPPAPAPSGVETSDVREPGTGLPLASDWLERLLGIPKTFREAGDRLELPALRSQRTRLYRHEALGMLSGRMANKKMEAYSGTAQMGLAAGFAGDDASPRGGAAPAAKAKAAVQAEDSAPPPPPGSAAPSPRREFAETAYFGPQLSVSGGKASVAATMPEQLTSWAVKASVLTADVKRGVLAGEVATKKDLMVRVEIPRFFRERDRSAIKAVVHNETGDDVTATVTLSLEEGGASVASRLGARGLEQKVRVAAHGIGAVSWQVAIPEGTGRITARLVARAGSLVDAEERSLPILPSRERLVASTLAALDGNDGARLALPADVKAGRVETAVLQIDPQLALPVLRSLPFLVKYPYECTEQVLNRFVPLSIVREMFKRHPEIAKAAALLPKRKTVTPAWEAADPRRLLELVETPWAREAKGIESEYEVSDLFEEATVERERKSALKTLESYQLSDGGFPWFPGGRGDTYHTLYVLASFADARDFGAEIPEEMTKKAFQFVLRELPLHLKPVEGDVALLLYASYVLTAYADFPWAKQALPAAKAWLDYAGKHARAMTPFGKAYAARAYFRLGEKETAFSYLDRALDGAREDKIVGVYWTPEKISWLWYTDTVEKHAFFLRTLLAMRPDDVRVPGILKWLLFNRKGNEWKSTKASAAAIYAILDFLKARGALDKGETFSWTWAGRQESASVAPTDSLSTPLRWIETPAEGKAPPGDLTAAQVKKTGPGIAYASLTAIFSTDKPPRTGAGDLITVERKLFRRVKDKDGFRLKPLATGDSVAVGDEIEIQLVVRARSQFEYVYLKAPRGAGFEAETLLSGWKWDQLSRYEETRDSLDNFFVSWLPHGEYVLRYRVRATTPGSYRFGAAVLQSMYAPEMSAYSSGMELQVAADR